MNNHKIGKHRTIHNEAGLQNLLDAGNFAIMSAYSFENSEEENQKAHAQLIADLIHKGYDFSNMDGVWNGESEPSLIIHDIPKSDAGSLAKQYKQYAHIQSSAGNHADHSHNIDYQALPGGQGHTIGQEFDDNYSTVKLGDGTKSKFRLNLGEYDDVQKYEDKIPGGLADNIKPSSIPKWRLEDGIKVEMEHTNDPKIAREIAMDHLAEDMNYYKKLARIHKTDFSVVNKTTLLKRFRKYDMLVNKAEDGKVFISIDGDNIGASVQRAAMKDDLEGIKAHHKLINEGQDVIRTWANKHNADIYIDGGDDMGMVISEDETEQLEAVREEYARVTGFTITIGVGPSISRAGHAMLYGKLNGKDQIVEWNKEIDEKLKSAVKVLTPEEKYLEEGLLPGSDIPSVSKGDVINIFNRKKVGGSADSKPEKQTSRGAPSNWKDLLRARFASNPPRHLESLLSQTHDEPYKHGDVHNLAWSPEMTRLSSSGMWNRPMPWPVDTEPKKVAGVLGKQVPIGGSDPFAWMDKRYGTGLRTLQDHKGMPLQIHTRSDLLAHDDYIGHLDPDNHTVNIHVFGDNESIIRRLEPGAPSVSRRIKAAKKLQAQGIKVNIIHDQLSHKNGFHPHFQDHNSFDTSQVGGNNIGNLPVKINQVQIGDKEAKRIGQALGEGVTLKKTIKEMGLRGLKLGPQQGSKLLSSKTSQDANFKQHGLYPQIEHKQYGKETDVVPASGYTSNKTGQAFIHGDVDSKRIDPIAAHENMHQLFHAVETQYGEGARKELAENLSRHIDPFAMNHIMKFMHGHGDAYNRSNVPHEEALAYLHTYQTDPVNRDRILPAGKSPLYRRVLDRAVKRSWKKVIEESDKLTPKDANFAQIRGIQKSKKILAPSSLPPSQTTMTFHGQPLDPNENIKHTTKSVMDNGVLHTPKGSFQVYTPGPEDEQYERILNSPDVQDLHTKAMDNWFQLHNLHQSGQKIPDELIAHSNIFSILSANTPVPSQELSYSRLVDTVKDRQLDFRDPKFAIAFKRDGKGREAWKRSDNPKEFPEHAREYWEGKARPSITQRAASATTGRQPGDIIAIGSQDAFSDRMQKYPKSHEYLANLLHHAKGDMQLAVSQMMKDKSNPKQDKDHPMKLGVGLGAKTARYALAMLGGSNGVVPDTHFVRHIFNLDQQTDGDSIKYLKNLLWNPKNHHILNNLDDYYYKMHPAAKFVQNKYFGGKQDPSSTFPAFWLHWLSIAPHEKAMGIGKPFASKNLTDHTPYWDSAQAILDKHGLGVHMKKNESSSPIYVRTAAAALELEHKLGSAPASMIFYAHLLPHLLHHRKLKKDTGMLDFSSLGVNKRPETQVRGIETPRQAAITTKVIGEKGRRQFGEKYANMGEQFAGGAPQKALQASKSFKKEYARRLASRGSMSDLANKISDITNDRKGVTRVDFKAGKIIEPKPVDIDKQKGRIRGKAKKKQEITAARVASGFGGTDVSFKEGMGEGEREPSTAMVPAHYVGETQQSHEAIHHMLGEVGRKHGDAARHMTISHLIDEIHPEDRESLERYVVDKGYNPKSPLFNEELITHLRDVLNSPHGREGYQMSNKLMHLSQDEFNQRMSRHKQAWKGMMGKAKSMKPEFFAERLASSEKDLQKDAGMMRLKGMPKIGSKPESNVSVISTPRQAEIAGRKAAQRGTNAGDPKSDRPHTQKRFQEAADMMVPENKRKKSLKDLLQPKKDAGKVAGASFYNPSWKEGGFTQVGSEFAGTPVVHHEAHHHMFNEVESKYGRGARKKLVDKLLTHLHPDDYSSLQTQLSDVYGYDKNGAFFNEEILNHAKDIIDHEGSRHGYLNAPHHSHLTDDEKQEKMNRHKASWKKITKEAQRIKPEDVTEPKFDAQKYLNQKLKRYQKSRGKVHLVHFSDKTGMEFLDPEQMGSGLGSKHDLYAPTKVAYLYRAGTTPENDVKNRSKSIYSTTLEPHQELYDLSEDNDRLRSKIREKNNGALNRDDLISSIKDSGYYGYYSSKGNLPNAVAIFHKHPVHSEQSINHRHPHGYDWHDSHTNQHKEEPAKSLRHLKKGQSHVHNQAHGPAVNEQAGGNKSGQFENIMSNWGTITPGKTTNLKFYHGIDDHEHNIDQQLGHHGYQVYTAGGKHGKPDLKNKNYNTKHLMIYDPSEGSGGDFGDEAFTRAWRKSHELAHALTLGDINKEYGEGRRLGKLGVRTPREMKRAAHWEWLAAHKQRDLMNDAGFKINDDDFHKELNTVMSDATHRAITGKFTDPSEMGFEPHNHKVDLNTSLNLIDQHASAMGLEHDDDTTKAAGQRQKDAAALAEQQQITEKKEGYFKSLIKGAMRRLKPFSPPTPSGSINDMPIQQERESTANWQSNRGSREDVPQIDPNAKARALNKLMGQTKHKVDDQGKRHFLLHRGMGPSEVYRNVGKGNVTHDKTSSWTPTHRTADLHAENYDGANISAWVHEDNIHAIPYMLGNVDDEHTYDKNQFRHELEVIVKPHKSPIAVGEERNMDIEPTNIHEAINARGKMDGTHLTRPHADRYFRNKMKSKLNRKKVMGKSEDYKPKHGDVVHLSHGITDFENGGQKIDRSKKFVARGKHKSGYRTSMWVVPHGEKDSRKGMYHRVDRIHSADEVKKSDNNAGDPFSFDSDHYEVHADDHVLDSRDKGLSKLDLNGMERDIDKHNYLFDEDTGILDENHPDFDNLYDFWDNHMDRIVDKLEHSQGLIHKEQRQKRIKQSGLRIVKEEMGKSNYGPAAMKLYDQANNARRKSKRTGTSLESVGPNRAVQAVKPSAKLQAAHQARKDAKRNKKMPVKIYTPEEAKALGIGVSPPRIKKGDVVDMFQARTNSYVKAKPYKVGPDGEEHNEKGNVVGSKGLTGIHAHGGTFHHAPGVASGLINRTAGGVMVIVASDVKHEDAGGELRFKTEEDAIKHLSSMDIKSPKEIQEEHDRTGIPF